MRQWRCLTSQITLTDMITPPVPNLASMGALALRTVSLELLAEHGEREQTQAALIQLRMRKAQVQAAHLDEIRYKAKIAQLTHESAGLCRYSVRSFCQTGIGAASQSRRELGSRRFDVQQLMAL